MKRVRDSQYEQSQIFKMLMIAKMFRRGLRLSYKQIAKKIYVSDCMICMYENKRNKIREEVLDNYIFAIAEILDFDKQIFRKRIIEEAKQIEKLTYTELLKSVARIVIFCTKYGVLHEEVDSTVISIKNPIAEILACMRRMLNISQKNVSSKICFSVSELEIGYKSISENKAIKYAQLIANQINYQDFKKFYKVLITEASKTDTYSSDKYKTIIIACSRILVSL